jgi:hypothetical protein
VEAARLLGATDAIRERTGIVRLRAYDAGCTAARAGVRNTLGENEFDAARTDGAAPSTDGALAYANCGRSERTRPPTDELG